MKLPFRLCRPFRGSWLRARAEARRSLLRLGLPFRAPESCSGGRIPPGRFGVLSRIFEQLRKLERYHGVTRLFVKAGELAEGVLAGPRAADTRGNLLPISHILNRIVSADDDDGQ